MAKNCGIGLCFMCLEPKSIIIDKRLKNSLEKEQVVDLEPCDKCKEHMKKGYTLVRVNKVKDNRLEFTGVYCVISEESFDSVFKDSGDLEFYESARELKIGFLDPKLYDRLIPNDDNIDLKK